MKKTISGFTIVELLIVIVVIAILAAISIVAYTGVQDRAHASKAASSIDAYVKILEMYKADHGVYPEPPSGDTCLGTTGMYPAGGNYLSGQCMAINSGGANVDGTVANSALAAPLQPYVSMLPDASLPSIVYYSDASETVAMRGVMYTRINGGLFMTFYKKGSQPCSRGQTRNLTLYSSGGMTILVGAGPGQTVYATVCRVRLEPET